LTPPGRDEPGAKTGPAATTVAAFDFDGTLAPGDSLIGFLRMLCGDRALGAAVAATWRELAMVPRGGEFRDRAKEALLRRVLPGYTLESVEAVAQVYADRLERRLRTDVLKRFRWHQSSEHRVVIVSASPAIYLDALAQRIGLDEGSVLATLLVVDAHGRLTGELDGANCRGPEKATRLRAWLASQPGSAGSPPPALWAYGDSAGDAELLAMADFPTRVTKARLLTPPPPGFWRK